MAGGTVILEIVLAGIAGYLIGAIPTGVIVCRLFGAEDVRTTGSGHTGGLNVSRQAGLWGGAATAAVDLLLGLAAVTAGRLVSSNPWAAAAAGAMAVVGHDWSIYIRFGGGIGLAKLAGATLGLAPLPALGGIAILGVIWFGLIKLARVHRNRATILLMPFFGPLMWLLGASLPAAVAAALGGLAVIAKTIPDLQRSYPDTGQPAG